MYISKETAQEIVEEISREIGENINLMDETGRIIASVDGTRIDTIHEGAKKIIREGLEELYITQDMETKTTRKGINLPIIVDHQIVGVVGITGERNQVYGYGNIVRRMTEILISDSIQKDAKHFERRQKYHLLEEWINQSKDAYSHDFIRRAKQHQIDLNLAYRIMIITFADHEALSDTLEGQRRLEQMEASIRHEADRQGIYYIRYPSRQICIMSYRSNTKMELFAKTLRTKILEKYQNTLVIGYDGSEKKHYGIKRSVEEAEKALAQANISGNWLQGYDALGVELFLGEISRQTMKRYLEKLFKKTEEEQLKEYMKLIEVYFLWNGSLQKMAQELYIHKNTVQYKLNKLTQMTGADIRKPAQAAVFYMALSFYRLLF